MHGQYVDPPTKYVGTCIECPSAECSHVSITRSINKNSAQSIAASIQLLQ